ncbi:ABC transporter ATP-binding protein [Nocardiopsis sp. HNM0947]|uniref:ABC transporter ATP-binding protein n=1 Tax=Nocardiopsis coralli TaxID=2772213 RepID=A0ABR9P482_9ACTN|nr:ABC transporter ATP-binding protein [Nocardiopsis coralli]MBE2998658.1 ABC transporter ATP-binding protein [Nocardiopsis coralli]
MQITATGLRYRYWGRAALDGIDLDVRGGVFGLLGPNGAGKTTFLRLVSGLLRPRSGTLTVGGHDLRTGRGRRAVRRLVGYMPQEPGLYPHLTVRENLDNTALLKGAPDARSRAASVDGVFERLDLGPQARTRAAALSAGALQRAGLAQALIGGPRLLVLDEPTSGLDPVHRHRFRGLVAGLARETTVVLSTHALDDAARLCDRVCLLDAGTVAFTGPASALARAAPDGRDLEQGYAALLGHRAAGPRLTGG